MSATRKILDLNAFNMKGPTQGLAPETASLIARRRATFGPTSMLFYRRPLNVVRAEGVWIYEADGTRVLDAYNNVPSVGHCHPRVIAAIAQQMGTLNVHSRYLNERVYAYSERLLGTMPKAISNIVFTCTGSESADFAIRAARALTGGMGLIVTANAYHGNTTAVTEISPSSLSPDPRPDYVVIVPAPDEYRQGGDAKGERFAAQVRAAIETLKARGVKFAGMIADSIFSSDGVFPGADGFLAAAVAAVHEAGGLYIADEVQPGFARTGDAMWGFERHGLVPDMVIMGKPMGNGYPMGAITLKPELLEDFGSRAGYFNTFGGTPVAAAAGAAVLDVIEEEGLMANARDTGAYLLEGVAAAAKEHASVGDVRGRGLYIGVEFVSDPATKEPDTAAAELVVNGMREKNVLIGTAGLHGNILKIRPPLAFRRDHADLLIDAFAATLNTLPR